ncbi:MAG: 1,4-dihydroxy-2-naphthoate octaprenyltransferase [Deltaproteobacteria bacterium]|nr:1,4-dihydroxy-2-naphthoate octaprenyltransferase [Deltaproteobacteria bacterium]
MTTTTLSSSSAATPPAAARAAPSLSTWVKACRPRTLPLSVAPVVVGTALAGRDASVVLALVAAAAAMALQIVSNLVNDLEDGVRGADGPQRRGEQRAVASGAITPAQMKRAVVVASVVAVALGAVLVARGGWPIVAVGVAGLVCAVLYTAGPWPLGWVGLGEPVVAVFFGPVAIGGTMFLHTGRVDGDVLVAAIGLGLLAAAVLVVNNVRDRDGDAAVGKRTIVVRFGRTLGVVAHGACVVGGALLPLALWPRLGPAAAAPLVVLVPGHFVFHAVRREEGHALDRRLGQTAALAVLWAAALTLAVIVTGGVRP